jgi:hypothetical protein
MKTTNNITKINELLTQIEELRPKVIEEFNENLKDIFIRNSNLESIRVSINNHEFNDGDPTEFSLIYDEFEVTYTDGVEETRNYSGKNNSLLIEEIYTLFNSYDVDEVYESLYGDEFESLSITRESILNDKKNSEYYTEE